MGVGSTVEEFEEAAEFDAEVTSMVDSLIEAGGEEPLTNDPEATAELLEAWDAVVDTSPVEGDFKDRFAGGGVI